MRLAGVSFAGPSVESQRRCIQGGATAGDRLLHGEGLPPEEADEQRDRLLAGFRWILVDEYQDIGAGQYELISALAGRTRTDEDGKLEPVRGRRRRPEHLCLQRRLGRIHPAVRGRLRGQARRT